MITASVAASTSAALTAGKRATRRLSLVSSFVVTARLPKGRAVYERANDRAVGPSAIRAPSGARRTDGDDALIDKIASWDGGVWSALGTTQGSAASVAACVCKLGLPEVDREKHSRPARLDRSFARVGSRDLAPRHR
jgi:hypothetical protein